MIKSIVVHEQYFFLSQSKVFFGHFLIAKSCLDCASADHIFAIQVVIVLEKVVKVSLSLMTLDLLSLLLVMTWFKLCTFMLMFSLFMTLFTPKHGIAGSDIIRARLADKNTLAKLQKTLFAGTTLHVSLGDQLVAILRGTLA